MRRVGMKGSAGGHLALISSTVGTGGSLLFAETEGRSRAWQPCSSGGDPGRTGLGIYCRQRCEFAPLLQRPPHHWPWMRKKQKTPDRLTRRPAGRIADRRGGVALAGLPAASRCALLLRKTAVIAAPADLRCDRRSWRPIASSGGSGTRRIGGCVDRQQRLGSASAARGSRRDAAARPRGSGHHPPGTTSQPRVETGVVAAHLSWSRCWDTPGAPGSAPRNLPHRAHGHGFRFVTPEATIT